MLVVVDAKRFVVVDVRSTISMLFIRCSAATLYHVEYVVGFMYQRTSQYLPMRYWDASISPIGNFRVYGFLVYHHVNITGCGILVGMT